MRVAKSMTSPLRRAAGAFALLMMCACTHLGVEDCPEDVLGRNDLGSARLRTSHYRVMLQDPPMAAARFLPYAIMSSYAYRLGAGCADPGNARDDDAKVGDKRDSELLADLAHTTRSWEKWERAKLDSKIAPSCEDDQGLMYHVWERKVGNQIFVVIAFRGTSGDGDWIYGNLWPVSHFVYKDNQLTRASAAVNEIIAHYRAKTGPNGPTVRFVTTGHSLGGGLAQHVLYAFPKDIEQAVVFDPSSITGFTSVPLELQKEGCSCNQSLGPEGRIIRVYQTYEILTNLRIVHKTVFPPERHVQEVRFPYPGSWNAVTRHSMQDFAGNLNGQSKPYWGGADTSLWYKSEEKETGGGKKTTCSATLIEAQARSCAVPADDSLFGRCPQ